MQTRDRHIVAPDLMGKGSPTKSWIATTTDGTVVGILHTDGKADAIDEFQQIRRSLGRIGYGHFASKVHYYLDPEMGAVNFTGVSYAAADLLDHMLTRGHVSVSGNSLRAARTLAKLGFGRVVARTFTADGGVGEETVAYSGRWLWVFESKESGDA